MKNIIISTENTCDLTKEFLSERHIPIANMHYFLDGKEFNGDEPFNSAEFYSAMRSGAETKTSMVNEFDAEQYFTQLLKEGKDIVHLSFASACSGTVNSFKAAAEKLNASAANKIFVVDSLCESGGQGLFVTLTDDYAGEGKTAAEVYAYADLLRHRICHYFCVDNIKFLARGGRISKVAAFIGGIMNIKPVLYSDPDGKLTALSKEITRKRSLAKLVENMKKKFNRESQTVYITQADCLDDARYVASLVEENFGIKPLIMDLGPVIGSHSGPGTVALFFTADDRSK